MISLHLESFIFFLYFFFFFFFFFFFLFLFQRVFTAGPTSFQQFAGCYHNTLNIAHKKFTNFITLNYLLLPYQNYSTKQSISCDANQFSASQEIPCTLWNPKFCYHICKCPPLVPTLSHIDPVHNPTSHILKIKFNITLQPLHGSTKWSLSLRYSHQNPVFASLLPHTPYVNCPSFSTLFDHTNNIG